MLLVALLCEASYWPYQSFRYVIGCFALRGFLLAVGISHSVMLLAALLCEASYWLYSALLLVAVLRGTCYISLGSHSVV